MVVICFCCSECGKFFSFVEATHEAKERRRVAMCPFCGCRTLVLLHRETFRSYKEIRKI